MQDRMIKLPTGAIEILRKIRTFTIEYKNEHGTGPSITECAEFANVTQKAMKYYLAASIDAGSLDAQVNSTGEASTYIEMIAADDPPLEEELEQNTKVAAVTQALEYMSDDHRRALTLRYGLDTGGESTIMQVAKTLNIGRDSASKMIRASEKEMRMILKKGPPKKHSLQNSSSSLTWGWS
jgi:DNA-directed RNA polymerase sigma subunit (sigma70/sigma32)